MVYQNFKLSQEKKQVALLIDPDRCSQIDLKHRIEIAHQANIDYIFVGGSLLTQNIFDDCIRWIKEITSIPVVIFPGNNLQIHASADAILFLSLISGRNADLLIGNQVLTAPIIRALKLEAISTGYMLIEGGNTTSVEYMSGTRSIPANKSDIAKCTAMAGEMLGLKTIYLDAGSGAKFPVNAKMINEVKSVISIPLIVGGGIRTTAEALAAFEAGADILVIGNAAETNPEFLIEIKQLIQ